MLHNRAIRWRYAKIVFCIGLLVAVKVGIDSYHRYYRERVADIVSMGRFSDNRDSRRFLLKAFGQALQNNQTAKYVGIVWSFSSGTWKGQNIELGFDRRRKYVCVYKYGLIRNTNNGNQHGCPVGGDRTVQIRINQLLSGKGLPPNFAPSIEHSAIWAGDCV